MDREREVPQEHYQNHLVETRKELLNAMARTRTRMRMRMYDRKGSMSMLTCCGLITFYLIISFLCFFPFEFIVFILYWEAFLIFFF
jgi:hypothetical protein